MAVGTKAFRFPTPSENHALEVDAFLDQSSAISSSYTFEENLVETWKHRLRPSTENLVEDAESDIDTHRSEKSDENKPMR